MKKGQRPSKHNRWVRWGKGRRLTRNRTINPSIRRKIIIYKKHPKKIKSSFSSFPEDDISIREMDPGEIPELEKYYQDKSDEASEEIRETSSQNSEFKEEIDKLRQKKKEQEELFKQRRREYIKHWDAASLQESQTRAYLQGLNSELAKLRQTKGIQISAAQKEIGDIAKKAEMLKQDVVFNRLYLQKAKAIEDLKVQQKAYKEHREAVEALIKQRKAMELALKRKYGPSISIKPLNIKPLPLAKPI